jgi:hypothetical protein
MSKLVVLPLLPFAAFALADRAVRWRRSARLVLACWAALAVGYAVPTIRFHLAMLRDHGTPFSMLEHLAYGGGEDTPSYLEALLAIDWIGVVGGRWVKTALWAGGWSERQLPFVLPLLFGSLLVVSGIGWGVGAAHRRPGGSGEFRLPGTTARLFVLVACFGAALVHHMVECQIFHGHAITPFWYAMTILPWGLALAVAGWGKLPGFALPWIAIGLFAAVQFVAEIVGTFGVLAPHVTDSDSLRVIGTRLAEMHPAFLSPAVGAGACLAYFALVPLLVRAAVTRGSCGSPEGLLNRYTL